MLKSEIDLNQESSKALDRDIPESRTFAFRDASLGIAFPKHNAIDISVPARFKRACDAVRTKNNGKPTVAFVTLPSIHFFDNSHFNYAQAEIVGYLRHFHPEFADPAHSSLQVIDPTAYLNAGAGKFDIPKVVSEILEQLQRTQPNVIAISAKLGTNEILTPLIAELNSQEWALDSVLIVGGTLPTFSHQLISKNIPGTIFAAGEGEHVLSHLYEQLRAPEPTLSVLPNIAYFLEGDKEIALPKKVLNLEEITWLPALDWLPESLKNNKIVVARSSVGCSAHCTFCAIRVQYQESKPDGKGAASVGWRHYPITRTAALLKAYERLGVQRMTFVDDEFGNEDMVFLDHLAEALIAQDNKVKFDVAFRLDVISDRKQDEAERNYRLEVLKKLKRAGLYGIFVGLESGVNEQLKRYSKGITIEEARKSLGILLDLEFEVTAGFIAYDPLMRKREITQNMDFLESDLNGKPAYLIASRFMNTLMVQQGTPYLKLMKATGLLLGIQPNLTFYDVDYIDARVEQIGMVSKNWFYEFSGPRYAVRDVARTPLYGEYTIRAKELMDRLIKIELSFVRALVEIYPDDEFDHEVNKLDPSQYRMISSDLMKAARLKWKADSELKLSEIEAVSAKFRELRKPLFEEFDRFLKTVPENFSIYN